MDTSQATPEGVFPDFQLLVPQRHNTPRLKQAEGRKRGIDGIFLGTAPWLKGSFMSGLPPHPYPVFVQSVSLPLPALLSPFLAPVSFPTFIAQLWACGGGSLSGQTDPPGMVRLGANAAVCIQGVEVERSWREVVRVLGQKAEAGCSVDPCWSLACSRDGSNQVC